MPRVGSSSKTTLGFDHQRLTEHDLLLIAAGERTGDRLLAGEALMLSERTYSPLFFTSSSRSTSHFGENSPMAESEG